MEQFWDESSKFVMPAWGRANWHKISCFEIKRLVRYSWSLEEWWQEERPKMKHITRKICVLAEVQMHLEEFRWVLLDWNSVLKKDGRNINACVGNYLSEDVDLRHLQVMMELKALHNRHPIDASSLTWNNMCCFVFLLYALNLEGLTGPPCRAKPEWFHTMLELWVGLGRWQKAGFCVVEEQTSWK